jgi:Suppressor of fused protein (SUFU)
LDPELGKIETPHGEISFLQLARITYAEVEELKKHPAIGAVEELIENFKKNNSLLITDLNRK